MKGFDGFRKKNRRRSLAISFAAAAAAVVVIISAVAALRGRDTIKIEEPVYTCLNGVPLEWNDGVRLLHDQDTTYIKAGSKKEQMERFPLIVRSDGSIIMQRSSSWNQTADQFVYRADYFTRVSREEHDVILTRGKNQVRGVTGFLYDNEDTYVFLEPVNLTYNDQELSLEPLTVVQVRYMGSIQIFGPDMDPVFDYLTGEEVKAQFADGKRLNLATDTYFQKNGEWRLLFMPLDALRAME